MKNIKAYNMMYAFTSMGGKIDNSINDRAGSYVYKMSRQNFHKIESLLPKQGSSPKFAQLYIYTYIHDMANEVSNQVKAIRYISIGTAAYFFFVNIIFFIKIFAKNDFPINYSFNNVLRDFKK